MRLSTNAQLALFLVVMMSVNGFSQTTHKRLSQFKPESGRYVKTEEGYMLPYTEKIPETEITFSMLPVRGGVLQLKSEHADVLTANASGNEAAMISIEIQPFWMGQYEVTWGEYERYARLYSAFKKIYGESEVDSSAIDAVTAPTEIYDPSSRLTYATSPDCPATSMTQFAARQYTKWLSLQLTDQYRLPTEAEWTYASLALDSRQANLPPGSLRKVQFPNDRVDGEGPSPVGSTSPNAWLLHGMLGNVSEYVLDADGKSINTRLRPGRYTNWQSVGTATDRFSNIACGGNCWFHANARSPGTRIIVDEDFWSVEANVPLSVCWLASPGEQEAIGFRIVRSLKDLPVEKMQPMWLPDSEDLELDLEMKLTEGRGATGKVHLPPGTVGSKIHLPYLNDRR